MRCTPGMPGGAGRAWSTARCRPRLQVKFWRQCLSTPHGLAVRQDGPLVAQHGAARCHEVRSMCGSSGHASLALLLLPVRRLARPGPDRRAPQPAAPVPMQRAPTLQEHAWLRCKGDVTHRPPTAATAAQQGGQTPDGQAPSAAGAWGQLRGSGSFPVTAWQRGYSYMHLLPPAKQMSRKPPTPHTTSSSPSTTHVILRCSQHCRERARSALSLNSAACGAHQPPGGQTRGHAGSSPAAQQQQQRRRRQQQQQRQQRRQHCTLTLLGQRTARLTSWQRAARAHTLQASAEGAAGTIVCRTDWW
jgi:hypothetical protein